MYPVEKYDILVKITLFFRRNNLIKKIYQLVLLGMVGLLLTSCSPKEFYDELMREYGVLRQEIEDFTAPSVPISRPLDLSPNETDTEITGNRGVLLGHPHRELLSASLPDEAVPLVEGYVTTAPLLGIDVQEAEALLSEAGISYDVKTERMPEAEGIVYAVEYAGVRADGTHYINPNIPVTLYVSAPKPVFPEATEENTIYLTFDDGPSAAGTRKLLDILDTYGIKGTFFLLGEAVEKHPEAAKEIYNRGHDVACHTMSHVYKNIYASADTLMAEVDEWTALMEKIGVDFTKTAKLFRYPGGSTSQYLTEEKRTAMNKGLSERGFRVYDWSIVANDALLFQCPEDLSEFEYIQQNFIETYESAMEKSGPKILLLHENVWQTEKLLPWLIEYLIKDGCAFAPLSSLGDSWTFADRASRD